MPQPRYEVLVGVIDGANVVFNTPGNDPYQPGTTALFLNGQLLTPDCWDETDPSLGVITTLTVKPPRVGEVLQLFYLDTTPVLPGEEVTPITGTIREVDFLCGTLSVAADLTGSIRATEILVASLDEVMSVEATLRATDYLVGTIRECDA